jgi:hypothetical protein
MIKHSELVGEGFLAGPALMEVGGSVEIPCVVTVDGSSVESDTCPTF